MGSSEELRVEARGLAELERALEGPPRNQHTVDMS